MKEGDTVDEKYAPVETGMTEPEGPKNKAANKKLALLLIVIALVAVLGVGIYAVFSFGLLGKKEPAKPVAVQTSEAELQKMLEERRQLESRIKQLEEERANIERDVAKMFTEQVEPLKKQVSQLEATQDELAATRQELQNISRMLEEMKEPAEPEKPEEPAEGSDEKTMAFSVLDRYNEKLAAEREALSKQPQPKYTKAKGVQLGSFIPGKLLTTLISSTALEQFYAVVETTSDCEIQPGLSLPAGTRFLGKVVPDFDSRRIFVRIEKMQYGDVEMPVSGIVLDERGNPGLVSKYIDPLNQAMWGSLLPNILAAAADAAQDMTEYYDEDYGVERERPEFSTENVALQGAADALRMQSRILMEMQSRKKPVIIVNRNIPVQIQISERIPLEILIESGVVGK